MKNYMAMTMYLVAFSFCYASEDVRFKFVEDPIRAPKGFVWESKIPADCPFEQSDLFNRIYFTGQFSDYICGDTFYPSWASDDNLYSPWTDGWTDGMISQSYWGRGGTATTGHAVMIGDDPVNLEIKNTSTPKVASALPYQGRYPAGSLVHDGIWYYGTYCLAGDEEKLGNPVHNGFTYGWPILGPIPGFQISYDYGKTWVDSPLSADKPLFPEPKTKWGAVKMGAPHFVDFGKNMEHSPDGKAYLVAMGAEDDDPLPRPCIKPKFGKPYEVAHDCPDLSFKHANLSWISADQIYLARVTPLPKTINDVKAYEFFAGHDRRGKPIWSKKFENIKPLLEWNNNMGCVTVTYVAALKKYLMCVTDGWPSVAEMDSYILEADEITGPWRIITYLEKFGEQSYFLNFPTKFIAENGKTMWLCHSANYSSGRNGYSFGINPPGGRYGISLHQMRFLSQDEPDPQPAKTEDKDIFAGNIAGQAKVTVSSVHGQHAANGAVDGVVDGHPNRKAAWASLPKKMKPFGQMNGQCGEWIKLSWGKKHTIDRVLLFDRIRPTEQVRAGLLVFSDGSFIHVDQALPPTAYQGLEVRFKAKNVEWVKFIVLEHGWRTRYPGLSEFAVFEASKPKEVVWTAHNSNTTKPVRYDTSGSLPASAPLVSSHYNSIEFTGRYANYTKADTWYPSWASDGNLYSPWTDGTIGRMNFVWSAKRDKAETGYAKISGDDPLNLVVSDWGVRIASALPFQGRYPCGSLVYDGVWYYGTYGLDQPVKGINSKFGWYVLGPLVGFSWSTDYGKTWIETSHTTDNPLFPEVSRDKLDLKEGKAGPFIKMGAPHFVDFGKNMEHSPDGKAYLVGHGAEFPDPMPRVANNSWVTGDAVYMARVTPGIENMNNGSKYEFFAGYDNIGKPLWTSDFKNIKPVFEWNNHCGIVTATYNPRLKRYFMCITDGHRQITSRKKYTSYILESDHLTGPWKLVAHMKDFGPQAYFLNIPSKFISTDGKTMWLCYSANYMDPNRNEPDRIDQHTPAGSGYALSLHEFSLKKEKLPKYNERKK